MARHRDDDDPIGDYVEWTNNRYLPGAYLGGNAPPWLRRSRLTSPRARRLTGILLLIGAVMGGGWLHRSQACQQICQQI